MTDVDGELRIGCFATASMSASRKLEPRMDLPGRKLIAAQVEVLRTANCDADVILVDTGEGHVVGIQGSGEPGVHSIRLPLARSLGRGFIAQRFRANCTYSAGDVHLIRAVSAGDELFMRADRHREAAVLKRFRAPNPITDSSLQKVLVAEQDDVDKAAEEAAEAAEAAKDGSSSRSSLRPNRPSTASTSASCSRAAAVQ